MACEANGRAYRLGPTGRCRGCGAQFERQSPNQVWCTPCRATRYGRSTVAGLPDRDCLACHRSFAPRRVNQRFCDPKCR